MSGRNPEVEPAVGDLVKGVVMFRSKHLDLVFRPYYRVLEVRQALFAVTGPSPTKMTTYGNVLFEWLGVREHIDGSVRAKPPYGHFRLVPLNEWRNLFHGPEPVVVGVSHE